MNRNFAFFYPLLALVLVAAMALPAAAQSQAIQKGFNGQAIYDDYCATCHGRDGKGDGPAARALKTPPIDLTQITRSHAGNFPESDVKKIVLGQDMMPSHGTEAMPIWGKIFTKTGDPNTLPQRVDALVVYLRQMQAK